MSAGLRLLPNHTKPHVTFILVDDWGSADAAFRERQLRPGVEPQLRTPTIDSLTAEGGLELTSYYVQHICSPTRTALLSARYQVHTGLQDGIIQAWARVCLPPKFGTLGDAFTALGYATHMVGKWHAGIYRDACLPWNRGFSTYYGFLTGSEHHYTKIQRIARGDGSGNKSHAARDFPDLRTHTGPVESPCITPPFAPPPPPPAPCGLPTQPKCNYTRVNGFLPAGHDVVAGGMHATVSAAETACSAHAACEALTFEGTAAKCAAAPCKIYLKSASAGTGTSGGASGGWRTLFKHPPPPTAQGNPECYSTHLFTKHATDLIHAHADAAESGVAGAADAAGASGGGEKGDDKQGPESRARSSATRPLFVYLALQAVHEPIEVPSSYAAPFAASVADGTRRTYAGMVAAVDECVLNVSGALKARGMWRNTILVLSNDNGGAAAGDSPSGASCAPYSGQTPLPETLLYDIAADPAERHDLAPSHPGVVATLYAKLASYNASSTPCCICSGSRRTDEMDAPPKDGYWYSFRDQSPNPSPDCALQNEDVPGPYSEGYSDVEESVAVY